MLQGGLGRNWREEEEVERGIDPGLGVGEDDGGDTFACSLRSMISLFSISIWEKRRSVLVM
jgi:hypothetical protein